MFKKTLAPANDDALRAITNHDRFAAELLMKQFMQAAEQDTPDLPTLATKNVQRLRYRLIKEELEELAQAYVENNLVDVADALTDLLYVVLGSFSAHGINAKAMFLAVHDNNMQKIATGTKDDGGKFIKSPDHLPPDLQELLHQQWRTSPIRAGAGANTCIKCQANNRQHKVERVVTPNGGVANYELTVLCDGRRVKL